MRSRSARAARSTTPPTTMQVRDATVGPLSGTWAVLCVGDVHPADVHAERGGRDLREDRERALADVGRARSHLEAAAGHERHGRAPGQALLAAAGEAGPVEVEGQAAPAPHRRPAAAAALARAQRHRRGRRRHRLERLLAADAVGQHLGGRGRVAQAQHVAPAHLERLDAEQARGLLHLPLVRERRLRRAEAAEGAVRRRVGRHRAPDHADRRAACTGRPRAGRRATAPPATGSGRRRRRTARPRRWRRCCRRVGTPCGGACGPGGAWWWRRCPRRGRR